MYYQHSREVVRCLTRRDRGRGATRSSGEEAGCRARRESERTRARGSGARVPESSEITSLRQLLGYCAGVHRVLVQWRAAKLQGLIEKNPRSKYTQIFKELGLATKNQLSAANHGIFS
eukprot:6210679-Pleurochrysis_carterae.AAC.1